MVWSRAHKDRFCGNGSSCPQGRCEGGWGGIPALQTGCPCGTTLVSDVSDVSVLKKSTREKWSRVGTLLEPCLGDRYARVALGV